MYGKSFWGKEVRARGTFGYTKQMTIWLFLYKPLIMVMLESLELFILKTAGNRNEMMMIGETYGQLWKLNNNWHEISYRLG